MSIQPEYTEFLPASPPFPPLPPYEIPPPEGEYCPSALGLVPSRTSDTADPQVFFAFAQDKRLRGMRTGIRTAARLITAQLDQDHRRWWGGMITFTYAPDQHWYRKHITRTIKAIREHLTRRGLPFLYVWVLELTQRGVPHYHLMFWLPVGTTLPKPDTQGWWPHGMTKIERCRTRMGYLVKYASKGINGGMLPKRARLHGNGGLDQNSRRSYAWWRLPTFIRDQWGSEHRATRAPGGGFVSRLTGIIVPSPYEVVDHLPGWEQIWFRLKPDELQDAISA